MKYDSNRHYLTPVARPYADDYPGIMFETRLEVRQSSNNVIVDMEYIITDRNIREAITSSQAICSGMLYCRDTMYRIPMLNIGKDHFNLSESIPIRMLKNLVEIHPAIVAKTTIEQFSTATAHSEYGRLPIRIERGRPLAVDGVWYFEVDARHLQTHSIFNLKTDKENVLRRDEFDIQVDIDERYVSIVADEKTLESFRTRRNNKNITIPSVYLSALITVLSLFNEVDSSNEGDIPESAPSGGWYRCIHQKLRDKGVTLKNDYDGGEYTIMRAAQLLLTADTFGLRPFGRLAYLGLVDDAEHS